MRPLLAAVAAAGLFGCTGVDVDFEAHLDPPTGMKGSCGCVPVDEPWTDEATLTPHTIDTDFYDSVISFRYATTVDHGEVNNDWDLSLIPDRLSPDHLAFRVNLVTDDRSCIEDLGVIPIASVPATVSRCDDFVRALEGHVYLVKNVDTDQQQYAAFAVTKRDGVRSATLRWFRSSKPDVFSFER
ncbi:MAG: hypothetical protein ACOZQL_42050 [Myxococcota bacterium]